MTAPKYRLIACDLDDTLAETKQPIEHSTAQTIADVLELYDFCVITGGNYHQVKDNVIDQLPEMSSDKLVRFHAMSTSGTTYHRYDPDDNSWKLIYSHEIPLGERQNIMTVIEKTARAAGLWEAHPVGELIEDRVTQVTFSALGQLASPDAKRAWDPSRNKRELLRKQLSVALPEYEVLINGKTSLDILQKGIDKAFGIEKLIQYSKWAKEDIIFFGDSMQPGGNDYPVVQLGVRSEQVDGWRQTEKHLSKLITPPFDL